MTFRTSITTLILAATSICAGEPLELPREEALLKQGGAAAAVIIEKAYSVLFNSEVFASRAVGEAGEPTSSCWALTIIVRYDRHASQRLLESISSLQRPEQKLYILAGLLALDPATKERFPISSFSPEVRSAVVHVMDGCLYFSITFEESLDILYSNGPKPYLFDNFPSLYETTDVKRWADRKK